MKQPRQYQLDLIQGARLKLRDIQKRLDAAGFKRKPRLMVQLGCGGGKTFTAALIAKGVLEKNGRAIFLCHRDFLLEQTSLTFGEEKIDHSYLAAGKWFNQWSACHIGMIGSMKSRMKKVQPPTLCFMDEGHHGVARTWKEIVEAWPETTFIFLSATPSHRSDGRGLDEICDDIICGPTNAELISMGALSDYLYYAPTSPDLTGVHTRMGDYVVSEIDEEMSKAVIIGDIVQNYRKYANNTKAIYFATKIETSKKYAEAFRAAGISAEHVDADSSSDQRKAVARAIAHGEVMVMTNVGIAGEGYDLAAQAGKPVTIETVGLCRPTKSLPLLIQQMMRSMRAKDYPGIILDHAGCFREHEFLPDDEIEWTLSGSKRGNVAKTFQCENCGAVLKRGSWICGGCGSDNSDQQIKREASPGATREIEHKDGELQQIDRDALRKSKKLEEWQCNSFDELVDLGKRRGYRDPQFWAARIWTAKEERKKAKEYAAKQQLEFFAGAR